MRKVHELTDRQLDLIFEMTDFQVDFCMGIIKGYTQVRAYKEAGGTAENEITIRTSAHSVRKGRKVSEFLDEHKKREAEYIKSIVNDQDKMKEIIIEQLFHQATTNIDDVVEFSDVEARIHLGEDEDGEPIFGNTSETRWRIKNSDELNDRAKASIESVETTKSGLKIKQASKREAAKLLMDMGGWKAPERQEITGADGKPLNPTPEINEDELKEALEKLGFGSTNQLDDKEI